MSIARTQEVAPSPVYKALLLPVTFAGVDLNYFMFEGALVFFPFIFAKSFSVFVLLVPLHVTGIILQRVSPGYPRLFRVYFSHIRPDPLRKLRGCKSYAP